MQNIKQEKLEKITNIKTQSRRSTITKIFLNKKINLYNGYIFKKIEINSNMFKYKMGEFVLTRVIPQHKKKQ